MAKPEYEFTDAGTVDGFQFEDAGTVDGIQFEDVDAVPAPPADPITRLRSMSPEASVPERAALYQEILSQYEADKKRYAQLVPQGRNRRKAVDPVSEARALQDAGLYGIDFSSPKNYIRTKLGEDAKTGILGAFENFGTALATSGPGQALASIGGALAQEDSPWQKEYEAQKAERQARATELAGKSRTKVARVGAQHLRQADEEMGIPGADFSSFDAWMRTTKAGVDKDLTRGTGTEQAQSDLLDEFGDAATLSSERQDIGLVETIGGIPKAIGSKRFWRGLTDPRELAAEAVSFGALSTAQAARRGFTQAARARRGAGVAVREAEKARNALQRTAQFASRKAPAETVDALRAGAKRVDDLIKEGKHTEALTEAKALEPTRKAARSGTRKTLEATGRVAIVAPKLTTEAVTQAGVSQAMVGDEITPQGIIAELATGAALGLPGAMLRTGAQGRADRADVAAATRADAQPLPVPPEAVTEKGEFAPLVEPMDPARMIEQENVRGLPYTDVGQAQVMPDGTVQVDTRTGQNNEMAARNEGLERLRRDTMERQLEESAPMREQVERNRLAQAVEPLAVESNIRTNAAASSPDPGVQARVRTGAMDAVAPDLADMRQDIAARQDAGYRVTEPPRPGDGATQASAPPDLGPGWKQVPDALWSELLADQKRMTDFLLQTGPDHEAFIASAAIPVVSKQTESVVAGRKKAKEAASGAPATQSVKTENAAKQMEREAAKGAKSSIQAITNNARETARAGNKDAALKQIEDARDLFTTAYGKDADVQFDTARKTIENAPPPKPPKTAIVPRPKSVAEADAKIDEGLALVREATTVEALEDLDKAYQAPVNDGSPRAKAKWRNVFGHRMQQAQRQRPVRAPKPVATTPATPPTPKVEAPEAPKLEAPDPERDALIRQSPNAPANVPGFGRRKVKFAGQAIEIPGVEDVRQAPGSSTKALLEALAERTDKGLDIHPRAKKVLLDVADMADASDSMKNSILRAVRWFLVDQFPPERLEQIDMLAKREEIEATGDQSAVNKFDDEAGLLLPSGEGAVAVETLPRAAISGLELTWINGLLDAAENAAGELVPMIPRRLKDRKGGTALTSGLFIEDALKGISNLVGAGWERTADFVADAWSNAQPIADQLRDVYHKVLTHPEAKQAHVDALERVVKGTLELAGKNHRITSGLRSRLKVAIARTPLPMWSKGNTMKAIVDNIEGRTDAIDPELEILRDTIRDILEDLRSRSAGITGRTGRKNYFPRIVSQKFARFVRDVFAKELPKDQIKGFTNLQLGDKASSPAFQKVRPTVTAMTDDVIKLFSIIRHKEDGALALQFTGDEADLPAIFTTRPMNEDGTFMPGLLPELLADVEHSPEYAGEFGQVKPKVLPLGKMTKEAAMAELRKLLDGANLRILSHLWDPDSHGGGEPPSAQARSRTWQLDGTLTQQRMYPHMGHEAYLDPISSMEQVIERQTAGLTRLEMFGERKYDDEGVYQGYSQKGKLEKDMLTLAELLPLQEVGVIQESAGRQRLASSAEMDTYRNSLLRSVEDVSMGFMRPFSEKKGYHDFFRAVSAVSTALVLLQKTKGVIQNELSGVGQAASKYGYIGAARLIKKRAEIAEKQFSGAISRAVIRTIGSVGSPEYRAHMRDMASSDMLEVMRSHGMGEGISDIHRTSAEQLGDIAGKVVGTFARSVDGMALAYHGFAQDMLHSALAEMKRNPNRRAAKLKRGVAAATGAGSYAVIDQVKATMSPRAIQRAMQLIDAHGNPLNGAAQRELLDLGMPFVMDAKSYSAGSNGVLFAPKAWRNRDLSMFGWMMKTVFSLAMRHTNDVRRQKGAARKLTAVGRKALAAGVLTGAPMLLLGGAPMAAKIGAAAANGALVPATMMAITAGMGMEGSGDEESRLKAQQFRERLGELANGDLKGIRGLEAAVATGLVLKPPLMSRDPSSEGARAVSGVRAFVDNSKISQLPVGPLAVADLASSAMDAAGAWSGSSAIDNQFLAGASAFFPFLSEWGGRSSTAEPGLRDLTSGYKRMGSQIASQEAMMQGLQEGGAPELIQGFRVPRAVRQGLSGVPALELLQER